VARSIYDELLSVWKKEIDEDSLHPIPEDFYDKISQYIRRLSDELSLLDEHSLSSRLLGKELANVRRIVEDLIRRRFAKFSRAVESNQTIGLAALTPLEREVNSSLSSAFEIYKLVIKCVVDGSPVRKPDMTQGGVAVRILKDMPSIVGVDMKAYGPFKSEDVATLPRENAEALIRRGLAVRIGA